MPPTIASSSDFRTLSACWDSRGWTACTGGECSGAADEITTLAYDIATGIDFVDVAGTISGTDPDAMAQIVLDSDDANGLGGTDCRVDMYSGNFSEASYS